MGFSLSAGVKKLLFLVIAGYIFLNLPPFSNNFSSVTLDYRFFSFSDGIGAFNPIQFLTHSFVSYGFFPLLGSFLILAFFGSQLEYAFGEKRFLQLFFIGGTLAALITNLIGIALVKFNVVSIDVLFLSRIQGGSGAHYAIMGAFAAFAPDKEIILFPIPIPIKIKYLIGAYVVLKFFNAYQLAGGFEPIADIAGIFIGIEMMRIWRRKGEGKW